MAKEQVEVPVSMQAVFSDSVRKFIQRVHDFYGTEHLLFLNPSREKTVASLEQLVNSLHKLSDIQDDVMAMLEQFKYLPKTVHAPIRKNELIIYADEIVKLTQNRDAVYALLCGINEWNHRMSGNLGSYPYSTLEDTNGVVSLSHQRDGVLALLEDFRERGIKFSLYYF